MLEKRSKYVCLFTVETDTKGPVLAKPNKKQQNKTPNISHLPLAVSVAAELVLVLPGHVLDIQ